MHECGLREDLLKPERVGKKVEKGEEDVAGKSSPKRHWPQKAVVAHAATAASRGELGSRCSTS